MTDPTNFGNVPGHGPLRVGGMPGDMPTSESNNPSTLSPRAKMQRPALGIVRDLEGGPEKLRERGSVYLPQEAGEDSRNYSARLNRSVYFNVFGQTVEGLTGFVFRKDPVLGDDVPPEIVADWENIDLAGTHGDVFMRRLLQDALVAGHAAVLCDFADVGDSRLSLGAEKALGLRPYWVPIRKDDILSWRTSVENGVTVLTQIVIKECVYVEDGAFGEKLAEQYRVLNRTVTDGRAVVGWRVLRVTDNKEVIEVASGTFGNQVEIPIAEIITSGSRGMFESTPPLLDLAYLNIAHYQQWSDYATSIHKTCVPIFVTTGLNLRDADGNPMDLVLGPNSGIDIPDPNGRAEYVSHDGQALGSVKAALDDLKADMATLGLAMLAPQKRAAETAEAKRIDKSTSDSALSVTARGLQDGVERLFGFHARYRKLASGGSIQINRDFEGMTLDASVMSAYASLIAQGLPIMEVLKVLQQGGRLSPDANLDELELEIMANAEAKREEQAARMEAQVVEQQEAA